MVADGRHGHVLHAVVVLARHAVLAVLTEQRVERGGGGEGEQGGQEQHAQRQEPTRAACRHGLKQAGRGSGWL